MNDAGTGYRGHTWTKRKEVRAAEAATGAARNAGSAFFRLYVLEYIRLQVPCQPSSVPCQPSSVPCQPSQSPANLPSDGLWLRVTYCPGWQVISPPPPLGDQGGCSMEGKGQPPPAAWPRHPRPLTTWGQERGTVSSSSSNSTSTPTFQTGQQAACPFFCHHSV